MRLFDLLRRYKWDLGIALREEGHRYDAPQWTFHIVRAPRNKWYADPFILDVTADKIIVLVEEFTYSIDRGRIAKLIIDKTSYKVKSEKIILDLTTHLSFPAILRIDGKIYICPENSASGKCVIYNYDPDTDAVSPLNTLCFLPLTDAVITEIDGRNYLFSTKIPTQNNNELTVYEANEKAGDYKAVQTIILPDNTARSAGDFFIDGNKIIRPAQNCNGGYGVGLVFQEVTQDIGGKFVLKEMLRKSPPNGYIGMHTYNQYGGYILVDLHARCYPILHNILQRIRHSIKGNSYAKSI